MVYRQTIIQIDVWIQTKEDNIYLSETLRTFPKDDHIS